MKAQRFTFKEFNAQFPDDAACMQHIFAQRYSKGITCAKCGKHDSFTRVTTRRAYSCVCGHQIYPTEGTIFHKSSTSLKTWFHAMFIMTASKNGVAAKEIERQTGVTYKTAWRMAHQIRKLMSQSDGLLSGVVEVDETFIGGKAGNMHAKARREKIHGRGGLDKATVLGLRQRDGDVRAVVIASTRSVDLIPNVISRVEKGSTIYSDEWSPYKMLPKNGYSHDTISHNTGEYVRAAVHTNSIEGFWGQLKRSVNGTFHHVSRKHLQAYVDEFAYRYNYRKSETSIFSPLAKKVAERHVTAA
jgi:hypothetical protein